jgi:LPXTG-motif cell wall-anchored protein
VSFLSSNLSRPRLWNDSHIGGKTRGPRNGRSLKFLVGEAVHMAGVTVCGAWCRDERDQGKVFIMRKLLLVAVFVGVVGLLSAAPALAADYPPTCTTDASGQCVAAGTSGAPTLFVAGASGQGTEGNLAFTGSHNTFPLTLVGIGAVVIGGVFVFASRRRIAHQN